MYTVLHGWKNIANHLNVSTRTVQRWERLGLPVLRINGSVSSTEGKLQLWMERPKAVLRNQELVLQRRELVMALRQATQRTAYLVKQLQANRSVKCLVYIAAGCITGQVEL